MNRVVPAAFQKEDSMKKFIYILSALAVAAAAATYSLGARDTGKSSESCGACSVNMTQASGEISVTGRLVSATEWMSEKAACEATGANASMACDEGPETAGVCPYSGGAATSSASAVSAASGCPAGLSSAGCADKTDKDVAVVTKETGDCCAPEESGATASAEYGIVDADGNFYFAVATDNVCNVTLGNYRDKTVKLNGTRTEVEGMPAIAGLAIEEMR